MRKVTRGTMRPTQTAVYPRDAAQDILNLPMVRVNWCHSTMETLPPLGHKPTLHLCFLSSFV
ncbi:hypothetical protein E2C01_007049 [Portunus trituberculatus]|uniref:Uncharacterized protein n=1 Tax=Portunus trituberculatus TaxID=210409 RepID=A0A5B7D1B9_PORTR|nr:hypothetical protein [Portunus trituberculatus]